MYFNAIDIQQFLQNKQFIDTAIVPLVSLDFDELKIKQSGSQAEYLMALTTFIEQQFRGRLMLIPPVTYLESMKETIDIVKIEEQLKLGGFKHVFFVTSDNFWVYKKGELQVVWLPAIPLESMDKQVKQRILEDQLKQVIPFLTSEWSK